MLDSAIAVGVFLLAFGGLQLGLRVAAWLPPTHLVTDARTSAHIGIGMLGTLAALVLGLMISSAKNSFDQRAMEIVEVSTSMVLIDRALAGYGADAGPARRELREIFRLIAGRVSPSGDITVEEFRTPLTSLSMLTHLQATILAMAPADDTHRWFQARALTLTTELGHERVLTVERGDRSLPTMLVVVVTLWVVLIFVGLGVFTVINRTVVVALAFCALAFAGSIFLILELDTPYSGVIGISSKPLQNAASELAK